MTFADDGTPYVLEWLPSPGDDWRETPVEFKYKDGSKRTVATMHKRKELMADRADAFAALPGGFGTGDELFEVLTWAQLGLHTKSIGLLNVRGFFDPLLAWLDHTVQEGFLRPEHRLLLRCSDDPESLLDVLFRGPATFVPPKWIDESDR